MNEERTLEELVEEELRDQLNDISKLDTGTPEKSEAIKGFTVLYEKRQNEIKQKAEIDDMTAKKRDRKIDRIVSCIGTGLSVLAYGTMFLVGLNFEKTGTITSQFVRNLVGKAKINK